MKLHSSRQIFVFLLYSIAAGCMALTSQAIEPGMVTGQASSLSSNSNGLKQEAPTAATAEHSARPLSFQTSGMRGVIDEGGYSASTTGVADTLVLEMSSMLAIPPPVEGGVVGSSPCTGEARIFASGLQMLSDGSISAAEQVFDKGVLQHARSIPLRIGAGVSATLQGKADLGVEQFLDAADIDPADGRLYPFLAAVSPASVALRSRVLSAAARYLAREPDSAEANYFDALMLSRPVENDPNAAGVSVRIETLCRHALKLDPSLAAAHLLLGRTFSRRRDYLTAIIEYRTALSLQPALAEAYYPLARAYYSTRQPAEGKRAMERFLAWRAVTPNGDMAYALARFSSLTQRNTGSLSVPACDPGALKP